MKFIDFAVLGAVALWAILAAVYLIRRRKAGASCAGCAECGDACGDCRSCKK